MYRVINFSWKVVMSNHRKLFVLNIIHGYLISFFMHRSRFSMDNSSHKVILSMDINNIYIVLI